MPRPPARRSSERSPCTKRSNMRGSSSTGMPGPLSLTVSTRFVADRGDAHADATAVRRVLDRVDDQVAQHLLDARGIAVDPHRCQVEPQHVSRRLAGDLQGGDDALRDHRQVDRAPHQQHVARDDTADVEQVVHHVGQMARLPRRDAARIDGHVGLRRHAVQHLDRRGDRAQRIAQFMAEQRQELVLGAARRLGLDARRRAPAQSRARARAAPASRRSCPR